MVRNDLETVKKYKEEAVVIQRLEKYEVENSIAHIITSFFDFAKYQNINLDNDLNFSNFILEMANNNYKLIALIARCTPSDIETIRLDRLYPRQVEIIKDVLISLRKGEKYEVTRIKKVAVYFINAYKELDEYDFDDEILEETCEQFATWYQIQPLLKKLTKDEIMSISFNDYNLYLSAEDNSKFSKVMQYMPKILATLIKNHR